MAAPVAVDYSFSLSQNGELRRGFPSLDNQPASPTPAPAPTILGAGDGDPLAWYTQSIDVTGLPTTGNTNLSGLCYNRDRNQYVGVENNNKEINFFDINPDGSLVHVRTVTIGGASNYDFEAICWLGGNEYAIANEGNAIHIVLIGDAATGISASSSVAGQSILKFSLPPGNNGGCEGLTYDPVARVFYAVQEGSTASGAVMRFFKIPRPLDDLDRDYAVDTGWNVVEPFAAENYRTLPNGCTDLSDCEFDPRTGRVLLLSDESKKVMDVDPLTGDIVNQFSLPVRQWEGVALGPNDDLAFVTEGTGSGGLANAFAVYAYDANAGGYYNAPWVFPPAHAVHPKAGIYSARPSIMYGENIFFRKYYGDDAINVDPDTGEITWDTSALTYGGAYYVGVSASTFHGRQLIWHVVHVDAIGTSTIKFCGKNHPIETIRAGSDTLSPGDTLIIADGYYPTSITADDSKENGWNYNNTPPGGDAVNEQFTMIVAHTPGGVEIDSAAQNGIPQQGPIVDISGNHRVTVNGVLDNKYTPWGFTNNMPSLDYLGFAGIIFSNSRGGGNPGPVYAEGINYFKMQLCGLQGGVGGAGIGYLQGLQNYLIEDCATWGNGRYSGPQTKYCVQGIKRRLLGRPDHSDTDQPTGGICQYAGRFEKVLSTIIVDGDQYNAFANTINPAGAFTFPSTGSDTYPEGEAAKGCIGFNNWFQFANIDADNNGEDKLIDNCVFAHSRVAPMSDGGQPVGGVALRATAVLNQLTVWDVSTLNDVVGPQWFNGRGGGDAITIDNSLIAIGNGLDVGPLGRLGSGASMTFNHPNLFNFAGAISADGVQPVTANNVSNYNPLTAGLMYIVRIEAGGAINSAGNAGARQAAETVYCYGKTGQFYSDAGALDLTNDPMWPLPIEALVRDKMRAYNSGVIPFRGATTGTVLGDRGFCVAGENLTNYIWGSLGNTVPPLECSAKAGVGSASIYISPIRDAAAATITGYRVYDSADMVTPLAELTANQLKHDITGLTSSVEKTFFVSAIDSVKGESGPGYPLTVTPG